MADEREIEAIEQWFRRRGLPAVVRGRPAHLLVRIVPAAVFIVAWELMTTILSIVDGTSDEEFDRLMESDLFAWTYSGLLLGSVVVPTTGGWLAARWGRRRVLEHRGSLSAAIVAGLFVIVVPVADWMLVGDSLVLGVATHVGLLVLLLCAAFAGLGSILGWALRAAVRQARMLGELSTRALPLLLLFTVFGFFTTEIWQVGASITRASMWLVVGLFSAVSVAFLLSTLSDEVAALTESQEISVSLDKLHDTPLDAHATDRSERVPLTKLERANMVLVLVLTEALQALVLATLMFFFFLIFGVIAVQPSVITNWIGHGPTGGTLYGIQVPVPHELLQVSLFIAAFSGLYFAATAVTDAKYRKAFFEPLTDHLAVSLVARDIYLSLATANRR